MPAQVLIELHHPLRVLPRSVRFLEDVLPLLAELGGRRVERDPDLLARLVAGFRDRLEDHLDRLGVRRKERGESSLVAHVGVEALSFQDLLQVVERLHAHPERFGEGRCPHRHDHELLDVHVVVRVGAAVQDIHHRHGQGAPPDAADVLVQRQPAGLRRRSRRGHGDAQDGVGPELPLVLGAVQLDEDAVEEGLLGCVEADHLRGDHLVHVADRFQDPLPQVPLRVAVPKLHRLPRARRRSGGDDRAPLRPRFQAHFNLHGRVPPRVQHLSPVHIDDHRHLCFILLWMVSAPDHHAPAERCASIPGSEDYG